MTVTDGISAVSRTSTAVSLFSVFELSKGFVVVDSSSDAIREEAGEAGISSKGDNAPSL
jgi:hypothetical protein